MIHPSERRFRLAEYDYGKLPPWAGPEEYVTHFARLLRAHRFSFRCEHDLQDGIARLFLKRGVAYHREARLGPEDDRVDFLVGPLGIEVKVDGSTASVIRQCFRYLEHDLVQALLLVTNLARYQQVPRRMHGKPVDVVLLTGGSGCCWRMTSGLVRPGLSG